MSVSFLRPGIEIFPSGSSANACASPPCSSRTISIRRLASAANWEDWSFTSAEESVRTTLLRGSSGPGVYT